MQFHPQRRPRKLRRKHQDSESTSSTPQSGKVEGVLQLQRTIGNKATQTVLQRAEATTIDPTVKNQLDQAVDMGNAKNYEHAIGIIQDILEVAELPPVYRMKSYYNLGVFYSRDGNNFQALEYFGKAIAMGPVDSYVYSMALKGHANSRKGFNRDYTPKEVYEEGTKFFEDRDYEQAIDRFSSVLSLFDTVPDELKAKTLYNLGACYYRVSKYHQALAKFEEALAIGSLSPEVTKFIQTGIKKAKRRIGVKHVKKAKGPIIF